MLGAGEVKWGAVGQRMQTPVLRQISSEDLMYSTVTIVNNTALKVAKRLDLDYSQHTHKR